MKSIYEYGYTGQMEIEGQIPARIKADFQRKDGKITAHKKARRVL